MLESELFHLGLSPREAKVYAVLLKWGEAPVSLIAKRAVIPRLSVYSTLERLAKKHLVSYYQKRTTRVYRALSPRAFLKFWDDQISTLEVKKQQIESVLPKIKTYFNEGDAFNVGDGRFRLIRDRIYCRNLCINVLKQCNEWHFVHDGSFWSFLVAVREEVEVPPRCVIPFSQKQKLSKYMRHIDLHFIPDAMWPSSLNLMIMGETALFILEDGLEFCAIVLESSEVVYRLRSLIHLIWKIDFFGV